MRDYTMQNAAFYDLSVIRNLWEGRVRKYRQRQLKEQERIEKSALAKVNQEWQYRIACKSMKACEISALQQYLQRSDGISNLQLYQDTFEEESDQQVDLEEKRYIFELNGESWTELPDYVREMTYLREWHIRGTNIHKIPAYIVEFQELRVLELPRNGIEELPVVLGKLSNLRELNVSYNKLSNIPPELGDCENLEKLELIANLDLKELPFELSNLKKLTYLDISGNSFCSVPVCVLRMSSLQWLDLSNNLLTDLPEDIDRLEELSSLFLHKNMLTYLPMSLANVDSLRMIVVSGDQLTCYPSRLSEDPAIKFINLYDNPVDSNEDDEQTPRQRDDEQQHEKDFMQTYIETLKGRGHQQWQPDIIRNDATVYYQGVPELPSITDIYGKLRMVGDWYDTCVHFLQSDCRN